MSRPTDEGAFADRIYDAIAPFTLEDADNGWALLIFIGGGGQMSQEIEDLASDGPEGEPGYYILMDPDLIPAKGLPWLGQFVGAVVDTGLSEANQRLQLKNVNGQSRGTLDSLRNAPAPYLTGTKRVVINERDAGASPTLPAYGLNIYTLASETPDSAAVLKALLKVKPAGILLNYQSLTGQTYSILNTNYASYNAVNAHYASYNAVATDTSGI